MERFNNVIHNADFEMNAKHKGTVHEKLALLAQNWAKNGSNMKYAGSLVKKS